MKSLKLLIFALISLFFCGGCTLNQGSAHYQNISGSVWHTTFSITYKADKDLSENIFDAINRVERSLSPFLDSSLITAINQNRADSVDELLATVFRTSQSVNAKSGGAFDPTVAPLVNLWGFGYREKGEEPTREEIMECLKSVGIGECSLSQGRIVKKSPATEFNFSAITKGFGCDEVARALQKAGCDNYMIEIGGEVALAGHNPKGELWHIQIDTPDDSNPDEHGRMAVIEVTDCGIATSGNYRNYRDTKEGRIGHTISPANGYPVSTNTLSVTVIAPSTMEADALATACMAMPQPEAAKMIEDYPGASALFIIDNDGKPECRPTANFPKLKK